MTTIQNPWSEWTAFRQQERDEILRSVADIKLRVDHCNEVIDAHKPKPVQGNAWQSRSMLRTKPATATLTPAQERDAALVVQRKREDEQREENRKAQAQGRTPNILYPDLGAIRWVQDHSKRAALDAGMAQNAAARAAADADAARKTPLAVAKKNLLLLEGSLKKLTDRLTKVDCDIAHFLLRAREDIEAHAWRQSGFRGQTPAHIDAAQKRWDAEMNAKLDTSLPLRGNPAFGKITRAWRPGHQPDAPAIPHTHFFTWEDIYVPSSDDEEDEDDEKEKEKEIAAENPEEYDDGDTRRY